MGRIRTRYVKLKTEEILERFPEEFGKDFEENKEKLEKLTKIGSKTLRNKIAGYITKKKKGEKAP